MRLTIIIPPEKEDIFWRFQELKGKYKLKTSAELLELLEDIEKQCEKL